ncbi:hypothetical protein IMZ48_43905 [Candidatus Bathyarchaeota archaeon]|nr:hypothetical protein [Candidatus Bathyarchaeota archaeon]
MERDSCHRLNKSCGNQTPAPPRAKKVQKTTRVAELEKRLDQLASQLNSSKATTASSPVPSRGGDSSFCFGHLFPSESQPPAAPATPGTSVGSDLESPVSRPAVTSIWPAAAEAEVMLREYKSHKARLCPFVIVPPSMSEAELRAKRPFLWKAIMVVERFLDGTGQMTAAKELLTEISRATFIEPLKSLDVLHGLLLTISW